jgi:hypothetical protein
MTRLLPIRNGLAELSGHRWNTEALKLLVILEQLITDDREVVW